MLSIFETNRNGKTVLGGHSYFRIKSAQIEMVPRYFQWLREPIPHAGGMKAGSRWLSERASDSTGM
jgi:hypothetical protein